MQEGAPLCAVSRAARPLGPGCRATEGELVHHLNWEHGDVSEALSNASRRSFVRRAGAGEVAFKDKGQVTAHRGVENNAAAT